MGKSQKLGRAEGILAPGSFRGHDRGGWADVVSRSGAKIDTKDELALRVGFAQPSPSETCRVMREWEMYGWEMRRKLGERRKWKPLGRAPTCSDVRRNLWAFEARAGDR